MTCVVLIKVPHSGGVLPILNDQNEPIVWMTAEHALQAVKDKPIVKAWGCFLVDLDEQTVTEHIPE